MLPLFQPLTTLVSQYRMQPEIKSKIDCGIREVNKRDLVHVRPSNVGNFVTSKEHLSLSCKKGEACDPVNISPDSQY